MRLAMISAAALLASTAMASADTFTFTGTGQVTNTVTARDATGASITTTFSTIGQQQTSSVGSKRSVSGRCTSWSVRGRGDIAASGSCSWSDATGAFSVSFTCAPIDKASTAAICTGDLNGSSGAYQGKAGTISWQDTQSADRKASTSTGTGQWN